MVGWGYFPSKGKWHLLLHFVQSFQFIRHLTRWNPFWDLITGLSNYWILNVKPVKHKLWFRCYFSLISGQGWVNLNSGRRGKRNILKYYRLQLLSESQQQSKGGHPDCDTQKGKAWVHGIFKLTEKERTEKGKIYNKNVMSSTTF